MAPEHMRSARAADVRSDIWSLGVILYELLGGQVPFDGETVTEVCIRVVNESPPSLLSLRPGLNHQLVAVVMRCLEKDPAARWQNVAQLATALEPYARSAQQGAVLRPWRSFEDTMDSIPAAGSADDTGPSTAVTMPTGDDVAQAFRSVPAPAPPVAAVPPVQNIVNEPRPALVSTDVTWGQGTEPRPAPAARRSPFTMGIVVGAVVSLAAAAAVIVGLRSASLTRITPASPVPPPSAVEPAPVSAVEPPPVQAGPEPAASSAPEPPSVVATVTPASLPAARQTPSARPRGAAPGRAKPTATAAPSVPAQPASPVDTHPPNGAPILR
jgi:serine/threonine-protein kinase